MAEKTAYQKLLKFYYIGSFLWIFSLAAFSYAMFEGHINPVVTQLQIESMQLSRDNNWTEISGTFEKLRPCKLDSVRWYYGANTGFSRVSSVGVPVLLGPPPASTQQPIVRDTGEQRTDFLQVRLDPSLIRSNSYAYVYHHCYGDWLWRTKTLFYDSQLTNNG